MSKNTKDENDVYTVLMMGARRVGKTSMLSAMVACMEALSAQTGVKFEPDKDTRIRLDANKNETTASEVITDKLHNLMELYEKYEGQEKFETQYTSAQTVSNTVYDFSMILGDKADDRLKLQFVDIRGEAIREAELVEDLKNSSSLLIAVDTPALMEEMKDGVGIGHPNINITDVRLFTFIQDFLKNDDPKMKIPKMKMVLFVPIKCERYYYDNRLNEVAEAIQKAYKNSFTYMNNNENVAVAITPILTLGDIVFKEYGITYAKNGNRVIKSDTPCYYEFRKDESNPDFKPAFSPRFCEQPLAYIKVGS